MNYQQIVYEEMICLPIENLFVQFEYLSCFAVSQRSQSLRIRGELIQQHYMGVATAVKDRIKEAPLDLLYGLACIPVPSRDPEEVAQVCLTIYELAGKEIHRRSLQKFLYKPNKKSSLNPMCLGYLRKPGL